MARVRTVDFLPEIFQTSTNRQFLGATLDQLVQEPQFKKTQGYVGRRVGPGVNANDRYVVEPNKVRSDYQLEPGVVIKKPDSDTVDDAITYPGIADALATQGAFVEDANRLYTSNYYTWDPFVDFDKFVNFSQYYWLPGGPDAVTVSATTVPLVADYTVTRADGVYTFSNYEGDNPVITLVRGGNYTFEVAQNNKETVNFRVGNDNVSAYLIDYQPNPTLTLVRGNTYVFNLVTNVVSPLWIKTAETMGVGDAYNTGVTRNGSSQGNITFVVPQDAPDTLYYVSENQFNMRGRINVIDATPGTGPGFWIQAAPGVDGRMPTTPNISSRDVLGVVNNGEDLGTVSFNVPLATAQNFYYTLDSIGSVDLVTNLKFNEVNNQMLDSFVAATGGIDGITDLNGRTVVFLNDNPDAESGGWQVTTQYDPLVRTAPNQVGESWSYDVDGQPYDDLPYNTITDVVVSGSPDPLDGTPGSFDSIPFDQTTDLTKSQRYSVWQIQYVPTTDGTYILQLNIVRSIDNLQKFNVLFGTQYASTDWYKDAEGYFQQIPLLTAIKDVLYYQDGTDPDIFGEIRLIDQDQASTINIDDIIGQKNYISPNGVTFTNGLKVQFRGSVEPSSYANNEYYVEGVGTAIRLLPVTDFVTPETYTESATIPYDSLPYDDGNYDASLNAPLVPDYITVNRASPDLNAWSRSNRWFHIDVINATASYTNTTAILDNAFRGKRPILEFRAGMRLYGFGTKGKQPVNVIDFAETDALSNINGATGYSIDGYSFISGTRVIFAADLDPQVRNRVYEVEFIVPDTVPPLIAQPIINLVPASDAAPLLDETVVCLNGDTQQGKSYYYDGVTWVLAQEKTSVNQPPLFDVYDADGISFSDRTKYPSTTFEGTKLFGYAIGPGQADSVLGFPLRYLSLSNVGDIVFDNYFYKDTFVYVSADAGITTPVSDGFARQYQDRTVFTRELGWQNAIVKSASRQQFQFSYDGSPIRLDIKVNADTEVPAVQVFVANEFVAPADYTVATTDITTTITLSKIYTPGSIVEVLVLSDQTSATAFYEVPVNLENNPFNVNSPEFTLGTIRAHYETIGENLINLTGKINGANNSRDLGDIGRYGTNILQQSSPLTMAGYFMRSQEYDIFKSLEFNDREYTKFKNRMLQAVIDNEWGDYTASQILDAVITDLANGKTELNSFYWSDMIPAGNIYTEVVHTVSFITTGVFDTIQTYDFTAANFQGLLVYLNDELLTLNYDYTVATDGPRLTVTVPLTVGDKVTIREYTNTYGNFVPNTPSKMGLYPAWKPEIFLDTNYQRPTTVIRGHDGSITVTFGDIRDDVLLEFERRIFNNLKVEDNPIPLVASDVIPGFFRTTDYTQAEVTTILSESFLTWVGWNKLDYKTQNYVANNPFTYNYSAAGNKINGAPLLGAWRGIYRDFYDTINPNLTPWEMLGFSQKPDWWENRYGPAPYTGDNLVLWDDVTAGYVADPSGGYVLPQYARPNLVTNVVMSVSVSNGGSGYTEQPTITITSPPASRYSRPARVGSATIVDGQIVAIDLADPGQGYITPPAIAIAGGNGTGAVAIAKLETLRLAVPTGSEGQLLSPLNNLVGAYDPNAWRKSWVAGDGGPTEAAWWSSSSYPFAVMRLLALTRPAEFFSLFADRDLYRLDVELGQYLYNGRYRLDANGIQVYGNGVSKASFINWIVDYNQQLGINSTSALETDLASLDVRLCYRMASFTDKQYLKVFTERSSPDSLNSSLLLPDESYNLLLYKNTPFAYLTYSAVIIQKTDAGYAVFGYSQSDPYFNILASRANGNLRTVSAGGTAVQVPRDYSNNIVQVPYGYVFTNQTVVVDFLLSYGEYLLSQGLTFDDRENGYTLDWNQMAQEFLYWSNQGWGPGSVVNLNPCATNLMAERAGAVVDNILTQNPENILTDQNRQVFDARNLVIERLENRFTLTSTDNQTISYVKLKFVNYENLMILDNLSIFNDLIYNPATGARQSRINIVATTTTDWNGTLDAQGFILNQDNVQAWLPNRKYAKGEIVSYKNTYWSAQTIVQPKLEFDYNDWVKSDYTKIQKGLLPNIANKADQLANSYNTQTANIERDNDLLSFGLIGFRPREYMAALNLDDVSQVNLYQQFLGTKGTTRAAEIFTGANLGKEVADYQIYENWAVRRGVYGANANRSFYELRLNEALLQADPSTVQVIEPGESSVANQTILLSDVWRQSYKLTSPDILPTTTTTITDTALPSAGYVNFNDVDITVFSLDDPSSLAANIDSIGIGTRVWVAKSNAYDWNVYRCNQVTGYINSVSDNLDGTSLVTFTKAHNLARGDLLIIRYFNTNIDGVYRVLTTPQANTLTIAYSFQGGRQIVATGTGLAFFLQTMRVRQASDILNLPYSTGLIPGALAWVDDNGSGLWQVLEKQKVFASETSLLPPALYENTGFGTSIAQAIDNVAALVGVPNYGSSGVVYPYAQQNDKYSARTALTLGAAGTAGFGNAVDIGNQTWMAAAASASNSGQGYVLVIKYDQVTGTFRQHQLLIAPNYADSAGGFGSSIVISRDERWMYVGSAADNAVYAYGRVDVPVQTIEYTADGVNAVFNFSNSIMIDYLQPGQITVLIDNVIQRYGIDYSIDAININFNTVPTAGQIVRIARIESRQLDQEAYYNVTQDATSGSGVASAFTVFRQRGTYDVTLSAGGFGYVVSDTITIDAATVGGGSSPANDITITVTSIDGLGGITGFNYTGSGVSNTSTFDLSEYLYTATNIDSFNITVNGAMQRPYLDYTFSGTTLTFQPGSNPAAGAAIIASAGTYWKYADRIVRVSEDSSEEADFGYSVSATVDGRQVVIGSPVDDAPDLARAGSVYVYDRSVERYLVIDTDQRTFTLPVGYNSPVAVLVNGAFLTNSAQYINGEFTVSGSTVTISNDVELNIGDTIEIESSIFNKIQKITANQVFDEARFGHSVAMCNFSCSIYTGAPEDGSVSVGAGSVQRNVSQSRVYGIISSNVPNPALTAGDTIRVNNYEVAIPAAPQNTVAGLAEAIDPQAYSATRQYYQYEKVAYNNAYYIAKSSTLGNAPTDTTYWDPSFDIPNVTASASANVVFVGDGETKVFDIGTVYSRYDTYTTVVYVDDVLQTLGADYAYNNTLGRITFTTAPDKNANITVVTGILTISVKNSAAATPAAKLTVLPGLTGDAFDSFEFNNYAFTQTIVSPNATNYAQFGYSLSINTAATNLVVGAPRGNTYQPVTFDGGDTYFDDRSTIFSTTLIQSGAVYTFDYLPSASDSVADPGKFVFGDQVYDTSMQSLDQWGLAVDYTSTRMAIGAPGSDLGDSSAADFGRVALFLNPSMTPAWTVRHQQQPVVDVRLLNSVYMYDKLASTVTSYLDFFDPLQGKILGVARQNIDYIGAVDPATYNNGPVHNIGTPWGQERVGEIWWDTNSVRFIDPNQDDITYASRRWGQLFPGSRVDIYQWIESDVTPANYTGPGTVLSTLSYTTRAELNSDGIFVTRYYFWVRNISTVNTVAGKKLSTTAIADYIENPRASGIAYLAPLDASTVAIYNVGTLISAQDTILHIEFDRELNDDNVHIEYELIGEDRADSFFSSNLYLKLQDSFCGVNATGAAVPDTTLSPAERYGVEFRPRQSMFADRFAALKNYLGRANSVLKNYPISETKRFTLLNSSEPEPAASSGAWDKRVADLEELGYQNLALVPFGYKYLVATDSNNNGLWTIYEVQSGVLPGSKALGLIRVQNYDTRRYWTYINWYQPGYNSSTKAVAEVANYAGLSTLTSVAVGDSVKVTANAQGKFEIYVKTLTGWDRVGLEDGTIEFNEELWNYTAGNFGFDAEVFDAQYYDQEPVIETRQIIRAINEELFVDELAIERNRALMLVFNFVLSEFTAPDWLIKTSLIDVDHKIRDLVPYQVYRQDNQDFVLNYIQEVKPYHTQIREFNLSYNGFDQYSGQLTDFDLPAYFDTSLEIPQYISPVLTPYTASEANSPVNANADTPPTSTLWETDTYKEWYNNYLLSIQDVVILDGGVGYTEAPVITVVGDCVEQAEMSCTINSAGKVIRITVDNPGSGYSSTAEIVFTGGNGTGARAAVVMGNDLVRSIKTVIKYDRYQYTSDVSDWEPGVNYDNGTLVRYVNRVWSANSDDSTGVQSETFDPTQWTEVDADTLSGVDRTMGLYQPTANQPGLELPLLVDGIDYPGVQVYAPGYDVYPGFDIAPFDSTPFDNLAYGPEGLPTYDQSILDAIYESSYSDIYLGTRPTDVNVEGGAYIDTYSSHAPEELVPGSEFDTLDLRVYTTPGADWARDGHGFRIEDGKFQIVEPNQTYSFADVAPFPTTIIVTNQTQGLDLHPGIDYTIDWENLSITMTTTGVVVGDIVNVAVYELGGGNQLLRTSYNGEEVGNQLVIPVQYSLISELAIFVNGSVLTAGTDYTYSEYNTTSTVIDFTATYDSNDYLMVSAIGPTTIDGVDIDYSWSTPVTQYFVADGSLTYDLDNSLLYNNPVNLVVTVNGVRARTAAGATYIADGSTEYLLPQRLGFSQALIADTEVKVYIEDEPLVLGIDYFVDAYNPDTPRSVIFVDIPPTGAKIQIYVTTNTQARVNGSQLVFNPAAGLNPIVGDQIAVTSWNDTRQQGLLTQVYVGPVTGTVDVVEGYDDTLYDLATVSDEPGSFDYSEGQAVTLNNLFLYETVTDPSRLWVTLNGRRIFANEDFTVVGDEIVLSGGYIMSATDIVIITEFTNSVAPEAMAFRIFQDMRGVQATYRITPETTTYLVEPLAADDDTIYVYDASGLPQPNVAINIWGVITIEGERIMYRERDTVNNTISGLLRGTAGTGAADHPVDAIVYNMGRGNLLAKPYQDRIVSDSELANGIQTVFVATSIDLTGEDSTVIEEAIEVYVGGTRQLAGYTVIGDSPATVQFDEAPAAGVEVTVLVRQGATWYAPGVGTPSNGVALQDTDTQAARFLRGVI